MTTTPFLGCKISLISKSEIRYEGILYTIDPKESTIALAKVRSYGTEERPAERQVPPREEIFEYIIFRAGDIKDLIVDDPPASIAPGLADPAIIQAHSTSTSSGATFPSSTFPQMTTNSSITSGTTGHRTTGPAFQTASSAISSLASSLGGTNVTYNTANSVESRSGNSTPTGGQRVKSPLNDGTTQTSAIKPTANRDRYPERRGTGDRGHSQSAHNYNRRGGGGQQSYQSNYHQSYQQNRRGSGQQQQNYRQQNHSHSQPSQSVANRFGSNYSRENYNRENNYNRDNYSNRQYSNYNSGARRAPMQSRPAPQRASQNRAPIRPKETIKFEGEFDFDKAEKEFKELEEKMTNLKMDTISGEKAKEDEVTPKEPLSTTNEVSTNGAQHDKEVLDAVDENCYNKGKSFFDHISCEALERERGNVQRIDWKAERKLNSETFGVPVSYRRIGFRGRGFSNPRGYSGGSQYRNLSRGGYGQAIRSGGGGDTRRYNGPQRNRN